ncbi:MAG: hypothetical protein LIO71_03525 [Ruminococcus sp.]|nr:hypothetical protein [Ruminococcus sp.]MCC8068807.1 hypothetical protein [Ruminococcus sp.]
MKTFKVKVAVRGTNIQLGTDIFQIDDKSLKDGELEDWVSEAVQNIIVDCIEYTYEEVK